jgi:hypothetical protein
VAAPFDAASKVGAVLPALLGARDRGLDPDWPPVLVALVLVSIGLVVVSVVVVFRALRSEARGSSGRGLAGKGKGTS